jgi:hypothetical protein
MGAMSTTTRLPGVWGEIERRSGGDHLASALVAELESGLDLLKTLPPAVTFFGGARIRAGDRYWVEAERMGELLADHAIPPRTGAGPGIMTAVPDGFRRRLRALGQGDEGPPDPAPDPRRPQALTQGFNIKLPFEQAVNPSIEVSLELVHFPTRKLMLYENALGIVIFPGGFGTLDELFEVWRLKIAGRLHDPFVLYGRDFWTPIIGALRAMCFAGRRVTLPRDAFSLVNLSDDASDTIRIVTEQPRSKAFEEPPEELGRRIAGELVEGIAYLRRLTPAVTVLGGSRLEADDPAVVAAEEIARRLAMKGVPTRAGGPGPFSVALARGGHAGARFLPQQAFGMRREDARNLYGADRVHLVNDRLTHKVLLTENSRAVIVLPGGLGTFDELFSILCQLQTRKIPNRRVVLFDTAFWRPFWEAVRAQMLDGPRQLISPDDMGLISMTDDPAEAARLALETPAPLPERR